MDLFLPRSRLKFGERAFSIAAPKVWNTISVSCKPILLATVLLLVDVGIHIYRTQDLRWVPTADQINSIKPDQVIGNRSGKWSGWSALIGLPA